MIENNNPTPEQMKMFKSLKKPKNPKHLWSLMFMILFVVLFLSFIYLHERIHQEIFRSYGIQSEIFPGEKDSPYFFYTKAEQLCPTESCILANNNNDILGYQLMPIIVMFGGGFFIIIFLLEELLKIKWETK